MERDKFLAGKENLKVSVESVKKVADTDIPKISRYHQCYL